MVDLNLKPKPYVGITGPSNVGEVELIIDEFQNAGYTMDSAHVPMLGYLIAYRTLVGKPMKNKRYPKFEELKGMLEKANGKAFTMIHYYSNEKGLAEQVLKLFYELYDSKLCRALQLNIAWPKIEELEGIKKAYFPELQIVFSATNEVLQGKTARQVVDNIIKYDKLIDYVLIDPSSGKGLEFNVENSIAVYNELKNRMPQVTVGFAGGLTGDNVIKRVNGIIEATKITDFCIDAEGGLRDKLSDTFGDDVLNINKVRQYLQQTSTVLK